MEIIPIKIVYRKPIFNPFKHVFYWFWKMHIVKKVLLSFFIIQYVYLSFVQWRAVGVRHATLHRVIELVTMQIGMIFLSTFILQRLNGLFHKPPQLRLLIFGLIFFSQFAFIFFYIYFDEKFSWFITFCFINLSIYIHLGVFLLGFLLLENFTTRFFNKHFHHFLLTSKKLHTLMALICALWFTLMGVYVTQKDPIVNNVDVVMPNLPTNFDGYSIALMTDVHIGPTVNSKRVQQIVEIINKLETDAITIVGDLIDGFFENLETRALPLAKLRAPVFFATGNHEYYHGDVDIWIDYFRKKLNINVLRNENYVVTKKDENSQKNSSGICFVGVDDLVTEKLKIPGHKMQPEKAYKTCPTGSVVIMLVHQPNAAKRIIDRAKRQIDLILSGHTHGGQFYFLRPLVYWRNAFLHGLYRDASRGTQVYVSAGVNFWGPPVKMWRTCELIKLTLRRSQKIPKINEFNENLQKQKKKFGSN